MKIERVSKVYHNKNGDVKALDCVSFDFNTKGMYVLVGPSGCGKTTLLQILAGKDTAFEGEITDDTHVVLMEQDIALFEAMSVYDNLMLVCNDKKQILSYVKKFRIEDILHRKVKKISIGQKKRVQLIACLLLNPNYLLCDEPTAALDHENSQIMMDTLKEISETRCVLVVTHDTMLAKTYSDVVINMEHGKIKEINKVHEREELVNTTANKIKKSIHSCMFYGRKHLKSRALEVISLCVISFVLVFTLFFGSSYFSGVSNTSEKLMKWKQGNNIVMSQPHDVTPDELGFYHTYHSYLEEDVASAMENIDGILGYDLEYRSIYTTPRLLSYREILPVLDQIQSKIDQNEPINIAEEYLYQYKNSRSLEVIKERYGEDEPYFSDYRDDLYRLHDASLFETDDWKKLIDYFTTDEPKVKNNEVEIFHGKKGQSLPLMYGKMPEKEDEILISKNFADLLVKDLSLTSIQDLIQYPISVEVMFSKFTINSSEERNKTSIPMKISGILGYASDVDNQIITYSSYYEDILYEKVNWINEEVLYPSIAFLIDPAYDSEEVSTKINQFFGTNRSHYVVYETKEAAMYEYKDPTLFYGILGANATAIALLLVFFYFYIRKRNKKEYKLLKTYQYPLASIVVLKNSVPFMIAGVLLTISIPLISDKINAYALSKQYLPMMEQNLPLLWGIVVTSILFYSFVDWFLYKKTK